MSTLILLTKAYDFAARKHCDQRRKDKEASPYINHPIGVVHLATSVGAITDPVILQAAILHDTLEDTQTTYAELVQEFGIAVANVVREVSDDQSLGKAERKRAQIEKVRTASSQAKQVKLCDKLYNIRDLVTNPPPGYTVERIQGYCIWSRLVVAGARDENSALAASLDEYFDGQFQFDGQWWHCSPDNLDEAHVFPNEHVAPEGLSSAD